MSILACGSSIAGTISFVEEAEFNEVMMVPLSDQLTVGRVGPALRPGWTRIILCMAAGPGWSTSHMSENESILSDIGLIRFGGNQNIGFRNSKEN